MHQKYYDDGFRVICITDGSAADAKQVLGAGDDRLWIGIDSEQTTLARYAEQGSLPIPRFYLVGADGNVAKQEIPGPDAVEELLQLVFIPALGRDLAPELAEARALYEGGRQGLAWKAAEALVESEDEAIAEDAAFLREKVEGYAAWQKEEIEGQLSKGEVVAAMGELLLFEFRFPPLAVVEWAQEKIKGLEKNERIHEDRFAWKKLRKALAKEAKSSGSKSSLKSVAYAYRTLVKRHGGSRAAAIAAARLEALEAR